MNQCNICRRSYVLPNDLQRHMKLKHKSDQHQENTICSKQQQQHQHQQSVISPQQQQQINPGFQYISTAAAGFRYISTAAAGFRYISPAAAAAAAKLSIQTSLYCKHIRTYLVWKNLLCQITTTELPNQNCSPSRANNLALQTVATLV